MTTILRRFGALLVLIFGVLSIGANGNGCGPDAPGTVDFNPPPGPDCCPEGHRRFLCGVQVALNEVQMPDVSSNNPPKTETRCFAAPPTCTTSTLEAENQAMAWAQAAYGGANMNVVTMQTVTCRLVPAGCGDGGLQIQDFGGACVFVPIPTDPQPGCATDPSDNLCTACLKSVCCDDVVACLGDQTCACVWNCNNQFMSEGPSMLAGCVAKCGVPSPTFVAPLNACGTDPNCAPICAQFQ